MKKVLLGICITCLLVGCSAPKEVEEVVKSLAQNQIYVKDEIFTMMDEEETLLLQENQVIDLQEKLLPDQKVLEQIGLIAVGYTIVNVYDDQDALLSTTREAYTGDYLDALYANGYVNSANQKVERILEEVVIQKITCVRMKEESGEIYKFYIDKYDSNAGHKAIEQSATILDEKNIELLKAVCYDVY